MSGFMGNGEDRTNTASIRALQFWKDLKPDGAGGNKEVHFVEWARTGQIVHLHKQVDEVQRIMRPRKGMTGPAALDPVWVALKPAYEAWLEGVSLPATGTALDAWPALGKRALKIFQEAGFRSVEDIAAANDSDIRAVRIPDALKLHQMARAYVANKQGSAHVEAAFAERDAEIAALKLMITELTEKQSRAA